MDDLAHLLGLSAHQLRTGAASAPDVGLEPDELEALADRLLLFTSLPGPKAIAALRMLASAFGEDRAAWQSLAPAFVALMDDVREAPAPR